MTKLKRPRPIAPKPIQMKSRKKARQITSLFHKLTRQIDDQKLKLKTYQKNSTSAKNGNKSIDDDPIEKIRQLEQEIENMGGREEYQRASQLSTKFHSTSKWVLKVLFQYNWLPHGRPLIDKNGDNDKNGNGDDNDDTSKKKRKTQPQECRTVRILEVGAINTELLDAAAKTKRISMKKQQTSKPHEINQINDDSSNNNEQPSSMTTATTTKYKFVPMYNIHVRAIDIRSTHESIEEQDFLTLPLPSKESNTSNPSSYDVIVCSMVLNCVTTPTDRGKMLLRLYQQLSPGGLCFLTIPKLCILQSKYINPFSFEEILVNGVGFEIEMKKDTPKVAFWVLKRPMLMPSSSSNKNKKWKKEWSQLRVINRGKKYRNEFGVVLSRDDFLNST